MIPFSKLLLAAAFAPSLAWAAGGDAPVATADQTASPPPAEAPEPLGAKRRTLESFAYPDLEIDRTPHGTISAAVGTGGYRAVAGSVVIPVGETREVAASIAIVDGASGRRSPR